MMQRLKNGRWRRFIYFVLTFLIVAVNAYPSSYVSAAPYDSVSDEDRTMTLAYFRAMEACYWGEGDGGWRHKITVPEGGPTGGVSTSPTMTGDSNASWFYGMDAYIPNSGTISCNNVFETGLNKYFGYGNQYYKFLQDMGYENITDNDGANKWMVSDDNGEKDSLEANNSQVMISRLKAIVLEKNLVSPDNLLSYANINAEIDANSSAIDNNYLLNLYAFTSQCVPSDIPNIGSGNLKLYSDLSPIYQENVDKGLTFDASGNTYKFVKVNVAEGMNIATYAYIYQSTNSSGNTLNATVIAQKGAQSNVLKKSCDSIVQNISGSVVGFVTSYADKVATETCTDLELATKSSALLDACKAGVKGGKDSNSCWTGPYGIQMAGSNYDSELYDACVQGSENSPDTGTLYDYCADNQNLPGCEDAAGDPGTSTSCSIEQIGWLVCGLMNAAAKMNDWMYGAIEGILILNPLTINEVNSKTGVAEPTAQYLIWQPIRDISNVLLVIAFLIIILSQVSNIGVTNYGIKKMLPRIIIVAIAINLSFFVIMLGIDLVNIIGKGLYDLTNGYAETAFNSIGATEGGGGGSWVGLIRVLLTGVGAGGIAVVAGTGGLGGAALGTLALIALPFLLGAVLAIFAAFLTLYLRNAIVIVLAIIAPLAFAAFLLPNTKNLFDKWRKLLMSMLFLYPVAALLFSGSKLAGSIIAARPGGGTIDAVFGLFVTVAPLFMLPWLAKSSGGIMAKIGDGLGKMGKNIQGQAQKGLSSTVQGRKEKAIESQKSGRFGVFGNRRPQKETEAYKALREQYEATNDPHQKSALKNRMNRIAKKGGRFDHGSSRTIRQALDQGRLNREGETENYKTESSNAYKNLANEGSPAGASRGLSRTANKAHETRKEGIDLSTEKGALEARAAQLEKARINTSGTRANAAFTQKRDSEIIGKKEETGAENTYMRGVNSTRSGEVSRAIQSTKLNEAGIKASEATQDGVFNVRRAESTEDGRGSTEFEKVRSEQLLADETTAASNEVVDDKNLSDVEASPDLQALRDQKSDATDRKAVSEQRIGTRLDQRVASDTDLTEVRNLSKGSAQAQQTAKDTIDEAYGEAVTDRGSVVHTEAKGDLPQGESHGQLKAEAYGQQVVDTARKKTVEAVSGLTSAPAAAAVQGGVRMETIDPARGPELVYEDENGAQHTAEEVTNKVDSDGNLVLDKNKNPIPVTGEPLRKQLEDFGAIVFNNELSTFAPSDKNSLGTVQDYVTSSEGAEALVVQLAKAKNLKIDGVRKIVESAPEEQRAEVVAAFNEAAQASGLSYAAMSSVDANHKFVFNGNGGGAVKAAKDLVAGGLSNIPKPALFDSKVRKTLTTEIAAKLTYAGTDENKPEFKEVAYTVKDASDDRVEGIARAAKEGNYYKSQDKLTQTDEYKQIILLRQIGQRLR